MTHTTIFLWNFRFSAAVFLVLYVDIMQKTGTFDRTNLIQVSSASIGILVCIQLVFLMLRLIERLERRASLWGRDTLEPDAAGWRTGRFKPLWRVVFPFAALPASSVLLAGFAWTILVSPWNGWISAISLICVLATGVLLLHHAMFGLTYNFAYSSTGLRAMTYGFRNKTHDWENLERIEAGRLHEDTVLVFRDTGKAHIPQYAEGHDSVRSIAKARLNSA